MSAFLRHPGRTLWAGALALGLAFLAADSAFRLRTILSVSALSVSDAPIPRTDPASPTGYEFEQHRLILPAVGTDGYHWIMQTERMLDGDGLRVRRTPVDNAPDGREVHWSSPVRWWLASVATVYSRFRPGLSPSQAVERVAPWANTVGLALVLVVLTPLLAWRFGAVAAALFALAWVAVFPLYESALAGILDHHGLAGMSGFAVVAFLVAGNAGWVRAGAVSPAGPGRLDDAHRLGEPEEARRWFIASGVAGAIGLWISAVTLVPVLIGIGLAALLSSALPGRATARPPAWRIAPESWRTWGAAGCTASFALYLLEYFPAHMGLRLEVNHPLYALAWLGAGDLLTRICRRLSHVGDAPSGRIPGAGTVRPFVNGHLHWLIADVLLIALPPTIIFLTQAGTFRIADPFLRTMHQNYILEFRGLAEHLVAVHPLLILHNTTALPLVLLPLAALMRHTPWTDTRKWVWRALLLGMIAGGIAFVHVASASTVRALLDHAGLLPPVPARARALVHFASLVPDAAAFGLLFLWPARGRPPALGTHQHAQLIVAIVPALVLLALTFRQVRWLGTAAALLLAVLLTAATVLTGVRRGAALAARHRIIAAACIVLILVPFPASTILLPWRYGYPAIMDAPQIVTRDVSYMLRARLGDDRGVIVSGPTTTTWMIYFGGFRGLGTLYWENLEGLKATAAIYRARTAREAKELIDEHEVSHLVFYSWDAFAPGGPARPEMDPRNSGSTERGTFVVRLLASNVTPPWLAAIPYRMPVISTLRQSGVRIYEVIREP